ncbi:MAG TPA: class I SAM-dependent methyltransferase [Bryobacteraceae bacterium]|nr:class I SAM-dependent methyltransferase [Bryobacteraceae bacterium]
MGETSVKQCCAAFYGSDFARMLLGDSFHPGGTRLTHELGTLLGLTSGSHVLDVACGRGTSAFHLASSFGCKVTGIDLSEENVRLAATEASQRGLAGMTAFQRGDAESLNFPEDTFDAIVCECAFCTFPDKQIAAKEFYRVLKPGGKLGLSDLTRSAEAIDGLEGLLSRIACIGDALPVNGYAVILETAGFQVMHTKDDRSALAQMVQEIQGRLLGAEVMAGLGKINLAGVDFATGKQFAQAALRAIRDGKLGYVSIISRKGEL